MARGLCWERGPNGLERSPGPCSGPSRLPLAAVVCSLHLGPGELPIGLVLLYRDPLGAPPQHGAGRPDCPAQALSVMAVGRGETQG